MTTQGGASPATGHSAKGHGSGSGEQHATGLPCLQRGLPACNGDCQHATAVLCMRKQPGTLPLQVFSRAASVLCCAVHCRTLGLFSPAFPAWEQALQRGGTAPVLCCGALLFLIRLQLRLTEGGNCCNPCLQVASFTSGSRLCSPLCQVIHDLLSANLHEQRLCTSDIAEQQGPPG